MVLTHEEINEAFLTALAEAERTDTFDTALWCVLVVIVHLLG